MRRHSFIFLTTSVAAGLLTIGLAGCSNAPPGGGFTNGGPPLGGDPSTPAVRSDLPVPDASHRSEMAGAGGAGDNSTNAGTGGKGGGQAGNPPAKESTGRGDGKSVNAAGETRAEAPTQDGKATESAAGGTKPAGNIQTGTPRSPQ